MLGDVGYAPPELHSFSEQPSPLKQKKGGKERVPRFAPAYLGFLLRSTRHGRVCGFL